MVFMLFVVENRLPSLGNLATTACRPFYVLEISPRFRAILSEFWKLCHASMPSFPSFGNLATLLCRPFQVSETSPHLRTALSTFWKPPHASVAHFPRFGNLPTAAWHTFPLIFAYNVSPTWNVQTNAVEFFVGGKEIVPPTSCHIVGLGVLIYGFLHRSDEML